MKKNIAFITGTRADFGKLKSLLRMLYCQEDRYNIHIFVTGMHMLAKYGYTCEEVENCNFKNIYKFINQNTHDTMDSILAKSILGFSDYVKEVKPDLIVVHGDRVEALAGATVGSLNNVLVAHIEGGEVSGTVDGLIRHAITKMSHFHFVANEEAQNRLIQLGEQSSSIFVIGSPDIDIMMSPSLPSLEEVKKWYELPYDKYGVLIMHPVTTEVDQLADHTKSLLSALVEDDLNYVVIYPNNDTGSEIILNEYKHLQGNKKFRIFPSMRFEYFLSLMKGAKLVIGNSSAGIREAPIYGVPSVNLGSRQHNRAFAKTIVHSSFEPAEIRNAILRAKNISERPTFQFGRGNSNQLFSEILNKSNIWSASTQKFFVDQQA